MERTNGYFGEFGGAYVDEPLKSVLVDLEEKFYSCMEDESFLEELNYYYRDYVGRESPLYLAKNLTEYAGGGKIYLKREDLNHTGAHKINNALGQILMAKKLNKKRIIAETGAGQHGVATATVCSLFGLDCTVYMGIKDIKRQEQNVFRMKVLGAKVVAVKEGNGTLKDAVDVALKDFVENYKDTYYLLGSAVGPHPYPLIVREFQSVIGKEARKQILLKENRLPDYIVACVGGGSNAIGLFHPFVNDKDVKIVGVEPAGRGINSGNHAASITMGKVGVIHGFKCYTLDDKTNIHSIAAGLDYPGVGPEHSYYKDIGRAEYVSVTDEEALSAFYKLSKLEGIIPALESSHAIAYGIKLAKTISKEKIVIVNLSGRGDKDINQIMEME